MQHTMGYLYPLLNPTIQYQIYDLVQLGGEREGGMGNAYSLAKVKHAPPMRRVMGDFFLLFGGEYINVGGVLNN